MDETHTATEWALVRNKIQQMIQAGVPDHVICSTLRSQGVPTALVDIFTTQNLGYRSWALDHWLETASEQGNKRLFTANEPQHNSSNTSSSNSTAVVEDSDGVFSFPDPLPAPPPQTVPSLENKNNPSTTSPDEEPRIVGQMKLRMQVRALYYRLRSGGVSREVIFNAFHVAQVNPQLFQHLEDFVLPAPTEISSETDAMSYIATYSPPQTPRQKNSGEESDSSGAPGVSMAVSFESSGVTIVPNPLRPVPNHAMAHRTISAPARVQEVQASLKPQPQPQLSRPAPGARWESVAVPPEALPLSRQQQNMQPSNLGKMPSPQTRPSRRSYDDSGGAPNQTGSMNLGSSFVTNNNTNKKIEPPRRIVPLSALSSQIVPQSGPLSKGPPPAFASKLNSNNSSNNTNSSGGVPYTPFSGPPSRIITDGHPSKSLSMAQFDLPRPMSYNQYQPQIAPPPQRNSQAILPVATHPSRVQPQAVAPHRRVVPAVGQHVPGGGQPPASVGIKPVFRV